MFVWVEVRQIRATEKKIFFPSLQGELRSALSCSQEKFESVRGKYNAACSQMTDMEAELFSLRGEVGGTEIGRGHIHSNYILYCI